MVVTLWSAMPLFFSASMYYNLDLVKRPVDNNTEVVSRKEEVLIYETIPE
jgi:hypothetical protein